MDFDENPALVIFIIVGIMILCFLIGSVVFHKIGFHTGYHAPRIHLHHPMSSLEESDMHFKNAMLAKEASQESQVKAIHASEDAISMLNKNKELAASEFAATQDRVKAKLGMPTNESASPLDERSEFGVFRRRRM